MPTPLKNYRQQRAESALADFKAWIKYHEKTEKRFARGEEIVRWWNNRTTETTTHVIEMMREMVGESTHYYEDYYNKRGLFFETNSDVVIANNAANIERHRILSQIPNQKQS